MSDSLEYLRLIFSTVFGDAEPPEYYEVPASPALERLLCSDGIVRVTCPGPPTCERIHEKEMPR